MEISFELDNTLFETELSVSRVPRKDYEEVAKVMNVWCQIAFAKASRCEGDDEAKERTQFLSCRRICQLIRVEALGEAPRAKIFTCQDAAKRNQGFIVLTEERSEVYVDFIVSHPNNLRSSVNDFESDRVRGAGTALLKKAEEIAKLHNKEAVRLYAVPSSTGFYEKNGYESDGFHMIKTLEKIEQVTSPIFAAA